MLIEYQAKVKSAMKMRNTCTLGHVEEVTSFILVCSVIIFTFYSNFKLTIISPTLVSLLINLVVCSLETNREETIRRRLDLFSCQMLT